MIVAASYRAQAVPIAGSSRACRRPGSRRREGDSPVQPAVQRRAVSAEGRPPSDEHGTALRFFCHEHGLWRATSPNAVTAGLTLPHSSGAAEGNVNWLKAIKSQMYGRASLDLLRKRVIHHPA